MKIGYNIIFSVALWIILSRCTFAFDFNHDLPLDTFCKTHKADEVDVNKEIIEYFKQSPVFVSLDECLAIALLNNYNIKVTRHEYKSAKWDYRNALAQFLPEVSFDGYMVYYRGKILVGNILPAQIKELALSGNVRVTHDLTSGGEQIFMAKSKKFTERATLNNNDFEKDKTILKTSTDYYELLRSKIRVEIQLKNLFERSAQLKLTETLMNSGFGTRFDVVRSKSEQALAMQNYMEALNNFRTRQEILANDMGIDVNTYLFPIEIEVKPFTLVDENLTIEELTDIARYSRNDVKTAENRIKALKEDKNAIYTEFVPKAGFIYEGQFQGTARVGIYPNNNVGLYLSVPIGSRLGVGTITKARAVQEKANAEIDALTQLLRDIQGEIISNYYKSQILKERIEISRKQLGYSIDSVKLAELRLDAGEGILIDVIQAQTIMNNARIELLSTIVDYNLAQISLLFDNGTISYDTIVSKYTP